MTATNSIVLSNQTAGELSDYTFNFQSTTKIEENDEIWIKFPRIYNPYLGKAYIKYQWG